MHFPRAFMTSSPPRSPHHADPTFFDAYFPSQASGSTSPTKKHRITFRPTRRDFLLCLLTLSFSYLLFSDKDTTYRAVPSSSARRKELPKLSYSSWWNPLSSAATCDTAVGGIGHEATFPDSVKTHGFSRGELDSDVASFSDSEADSETGYEWDSGEEEDEDDGQEAGSTILKGFQAGWTLMDNLYIYNGSFYVVTTRRREWPELRLMTSTGLPATPEPGNLQAREPRGDEIMYITPREAANLWGPRVYQMEGTTWLFNDGQFIDHYYHFTAELLMGTWRSYCSLDPDISPTGETHLSPPRRIWFLHQDVREWRDSPKFNPLILFSLFPSVSVLYPNDFADMKNMTISHRPKAYVLERALLADRSAAFRGEWTIPTSRTVANALRVGTTSRWWWEPLRRQVLRYSGVSEDIINRNLEGHGAVDPLYLAPAGVGNILDIDLAGKYVPDAHTLAPPEDYKPLVTYISRQSSRRRLTADSHTRLVDSLEKRAAKVGFELIVVEAEKLTKEEQIALAARTTIMLGVHGNGLTHLVWMPATPRSAVIEMFFVGGFARDYQWTAHALGIRHFGIRHNEVVTAPKLPDVLYPEGFQGTSITVDGETVADVIEGRLTGNL